MMITMRKCQALQDKEENPYTEPYTEPYTDPYTSRIRTRILPCVPLQDEEENLLGEEHTVRTLQSMLKTQAPGYEVILDHPNPNPNPDWIRGHHQEHAEIRRRIGVSSKARDLL